MGCLREAGTPWLMSTCCKCRGSSAPLYMARGDSAMLVPPARRRAMSDAANMQSHLDSLSNTELKSSVFCAGAPGCSRAGSLGSAQQAFPEGARMGRSPTALPESGNAGRLGFAHSVTPHISDIGRQLAAKYALNFDSGRLRAPSQDLEDLCSGSH